LKPVAWRKKNVPILFGTSLPSKLLIARCYSTIRARIRPNGFERILAHRINCQRATASLSSRVASKQLDEYRESGPGCQPLRQRIFGFPQRHKPARSTGHCERNSETKFARLASRS